MPQITAHVKCRADTMVNYTTSHTTSDLLGILDLQRRNLSANIAEEDMKSQGFVTVHHQLHDLQKMNDIERHVIAVDVDRVVGYLLAMTAASKQDIPVLVPMFDLFDRIIVRGKTLSAYHFIVVGQACVDKAYRGSGVFDGMYRYYRDQFRSRYDLAVTEIATSNTRSLRAHARVGFQSVHEYIAPDQLAWSIVVMDW